MFKRIISVCIISFLMTAAFSLQVSAGIVDTRYAKFYELDTTQAKVNGLKTTVILPSSKTIPDDSSYIIVYLGLGSYKCGLSASQRYSDSKGKIRWHCTASSSNGDTNVKKADRFFSDGESVNLQLSIEEKHVVFKVNGEAIYVSNKTFTQGLSDPRVVVASCEYDALNTAQLSKPKLPPWTVFHNQIGLKSIKYLSSDKWNTLNSSNSTSKTYNWPANRPTSAFPNPNMYDATPITDSGNVYTSLSK